MGIVVQSPFILLYLHWLDIPSQIKDAQFIESDTWAQGHLLVLVV